MLFYPNIFIIKRSKIKEHIQLPDYWFVKHFKMSGKPERHEADASLKIVRKKFEFERFYPVAWLNAWPPAGQAARLPRPRPRDLRVRTRAPAPLLPQGYRLPTPDARRKDERRKRPREVAWVGTVPSPGGRKIFPILSSSHSVFTLNK